MLKCIYPKACHYDKVTGSACAPGYKGNLCGECDLGEYGQTEDGKCVKCDPRLWVNIFYFIWWLFKRMCPVSYAIYKYKKLIKYSGEAALTKDQIMGAVLLKLLMNYLSIVLLMRLSLEDMKPEWKQSLDTKAFQFSSQGTPFSTEDCILKLIFPFD